MVKRLNDHKGQVTVEVAVLFAFVIAGLIAMALYLQRGVQGGVRSNADSLGGQLSSIEEWQAYSRSSTDEIGGDDGDVLSGQFSNNCQGVGGETIPNCVPGDGGVAAVLAAFPPAPDPTALAVPLGTQEAMDQVLDLQEDTHNLP